MGGVAETDPPPVPLARPGESVVVYSLDDNDVVKPLVNVRMISDQWKEFLPPSANLRYVFDPIRLPLYPYRIEHVYALDAVGLGVVVPDTRIVVARSLPDGTDEFLFDGFVQIPQADANSDTELVTFQALGVPVRCWDVPLAGAVYRDTEGANLPPDTTLDFTKTRDIPTDLPTRFNPDGEPNAVTADGESTVRGQKYPVFLDWRAEGPPDLRRAWTLEMAVRYLLCVGNDEVWVKNPSTGAIKAGLLIVEPTTDDGIINLDDATTFTYVSPELPDVDVWGMAWPDAIRKLIEPYGFTLEFVLTKDEAKLPRWDVVFSRKDDNKRVKALNLQKAGGTYKPEQTNLNTLRLGRDGMAIVNNYHVGSGPTRWEADFILAPEFEPNVADLARLDDFKRDTANLNWSVSDNSTKYRVWGFGEAGDPYFVFKTGIWVGTSIIPDLQPLFDPDNPDPKGSRTFARLRRPALHNLVTLNFDETPRAAELFISADYVNTGPRLWDGESGFWAPVTHGWKLRKDALGIILTAPNLEELVCNAGNPGEFSLASVVTSGKLRVITSLAGTEDSSPKFSFLLKCAITDDRGIEALARRRAASPTKYNITRRVDQRDRFHNETVSEWSDYFEDADSAKVRDDTAKVAAMAKGYRRSHEMARFSGSATIPYIVSNSTYRIGDKVTQITGRKIDLKMNAAAEQSETPQYPVIVGYDRTYEPHQGTTYHLQDFRAEPLEKHARKPKPKHPDLLGDV